jgi:hypothetical protein
MARRRSLEFQHHDGDDAIGEGFEAGRAGDLVGHGWFVGFQCREQNTRRWRVKFPCAVGTRSLPAVKAMG